MLIDSPSLRGFILSLYEIVGESVKRITPFGEVAGHAQLSDEAAHAAFANLKRQQLIFSTNSGCVGLTDAGRAVARSPNSKASMTCWALIGQQQ